MNYTETYNWLEANQQYLTTAIAHLRKMLEQHIGRFQETASPIADVQQLSQKLLQMREEMHIPPALEKLCELFNLSSFERDILLLSAGVELDSAVAALCASANGDSRKPYPTFSLAMSFLPDAHWSALTPVGRLRYWRLIEPGSGDTLTAGPHRIDERILHYLTGVQYVDERLKGFVKPVSSTGDTVPSHSEITRQAIAVWDGAIQSGNIPVLQLYGEDSKSRQTIAATACSGLGINLHTMQAHVMPIEPRELDALIRLWEREAILTQSALLLDCTGIDNADHARGAAISRFIESARCAIIVIGKEQRPISDRPSVSWEVHKPMPREQYSLWREILGSNNANGQIESLVSQFNLNVSTLRDVCDEALRIRLVEEQNGDEDFNTILWNTCRAKARPRLEALAQKISSAAGWNDLVLPEMQKRLLSEILAHVRQRLKVYETWGFGPRNARGLGISALFTGPSGTGKTMAAEVLANELSLDLFRIDLSQVVSKYIGETEKNLRRVFDAAETGGAILLFDEADALFGKRSEVKDSHDRYANIEISYLLQRMEAYRGLAILTTNMKDALDAAFLRRIRFVVHFPFPGIEQRIEIWRRIFPIDTPTNGLEPHTLSQLNVAGGNIRNIALYAAFLAADADEPVQMTHVLRAARVEYNKLEKALTDTEIRGWV